jgi:hypothetical protein
VRHVAEPLGPWRNLLRGDRTEAARFVTADPCKNSVRPRRKRSCVTSYFSEGRNQGPLRSGAGRPLDDLRTLDAGRALACRRPSASASASPLIVVVLERRNFWPGSAHRFAIVGNSHSQVRPHIAEEPHEDQHRSQTTGKEDAGHSREDHELKAEQHASEKSGPATHLSAP